MAPLPGSSTASRTARPWPGSWPGRRAWAGAWSRLEGWVGHAPQTLRALVRADEIWLVALAAAVGVAAGLAVVGMGATAQLTHTLLYRLQPGEQLSSLVSLHSRFGALVPVVGGVAVGVAGLAVARWAPRRAVDPIEANALYGGALSLRDSLVVVAQTLLSNGVGALFNVVSRW